MERAAMEKEKLLEEEKKVEKLLRETEDHLADLSYAERYLGYRPRRKNDDSGAGTKKKNGKTKGGGSKSKVQK